MFNIKILLFFLILIPLSSSAVNIIDSSTNPVNEQTLQGVSILDIREIFNNNTAFVNESANWVTPSLGVLGDANATQFDNINNVLNIDESWVDSLWCRLTGCTMTGDIDMNSNSIQNVDIIFLDDSDHLFKVGADSFDGLSTEAFSLQHSEERGAGTITFIVSFNKTNSDTDGINIMAQAGLNNSGGYLGNSWMIAPNNLTNNLTKLSNCFFVINETGSTARIACDTDDTGADFFVQDDIQSGGTMFADGGIRAETLVDFIMNGQDVNIQNGSLHIFTPVTFEKGVVQGNEVTTFIEDFTGGLGSFTNLQTDLGNWFPTANILCDDGDCANALGISGVGNIIMEANISTVNINSTSLNFIYSLVNILGANDFEVTVNNNVGSGEVSIFTDSTNNVVLSSQSIALPASMSNQPKVSIRFNCDVTNANRDCFVDTISVNGTAIATTLTNVSSFDSVIKFGDGILAADGFPQRGIIYNASGDIIIIRGNATFENIIEQDLNVTNSISLNGTTIFDWSGVINSPLFPEYFLVNGSSVMSGNMDVGGFNLSNVGSTMADRYLMSENGDTSNYEFWFQERTSSTNNRIMAFGETQDSNFGFVVAPNNTNQNDVHVNIWTTDIDGGGSPSIFGGMTLEGNSSSGMLKLFSSANDVFIEAGGTTGLTVDTSGFVHIPSRLSHEGNPTTFFIFGTNVISSVIDDVVTISTYDVIGEKFVDIGNGVDDIDFELFGNGKQSFNFNFGLDRITIDSTTRFLDDVKSQYGDDGDAAIYFNETDLIINSSSGDVHFVNNSVFMDNNLTVEEIVTGATFSATDDGNILQLNGKRWAHASGSIKNVFIGDEAGRPQTTGEESVAIGQFSLRSATSGNNNFALGRNALRFLTVADDNIGIGVNAVQNTVSGGRNVGIGRNALAATTSVDNVGIGNFAGSTIVSGNHNVILGAGSTTSATTTTHSVLLGVDSTVGTREFVVSQVDDIFIGKDRDNVKYWLGADENVSFSYDGSSLNFILNESGSSNMNIIGADLNMVDGNITTSDGGKLWSNSTCMFLSSPDGSVTLEVCNA